MTIGRHQVIGCLVLLLFPIGLVAGEAQVPLAVSGSAASQDTPWRPTPGALAVDLDVINGFGVGLTHWYSDAHSEVDVLSLGFNAYTQTQDQNIDWSAQSVVWSVGLASLQRWKFHELGRFADLNLVGGPFATYSHSGYQETNPGSPGGNVADAYSLGIKGGLDLEVYFLPGWSVGASYLASGYYQSSYEPFGPPGNSIQYWKWNVGIGAGQVGLNYYFRP